MKTGAIQEKTILTERQRHYYESIVPKLDKKILDLNFGMRINTCLVNAGIYTIEELMKALKEERHIEMLGRERDDILWKLEISRLKNIK